MINTAKDKWLADLVTMTCQNYENKILFSLVKCGKGFVGKIKELPPKLFVEWSEREDGPELIQKAVLEAEEVFMKAFYENGSLF